MMSISPDQLSSRLQRGIAPAYLLAGEEPLLLQEAGDAVRAAARTAGYSERTVLHVEANFDWDSLRGSGDNLSLFASRRLLELRLGDRSPGAEGSAALTEWLSEPVPDTVLIVHAGKLDKRARESAWFGAFERSGVAMYAWPVRPEALPAWIEKRLGAAGLGADPDAIALLAQRTEGNLLACAQEIDKLKWLGSEGRVEAQRVLESTADSARFDIFDLVDKTLEGRQVEVLQVLERLREEGVDVVPIISVLAGTLRQLYRGSRSANPESGLLQAGVWKSRLPLFRKALRRLTSDQLLELVAEASWVDRVSKGAGQLATEYGQKRALRIDPWPELIKLATRLAGVAWQPARP